MTKAERRALIAVQNGDVIRIYRSGGNVLKCKKPGVSPNTLWTVLAYRWIEDEPGTEHGTLTTTCRMRLTKQGSSALAM